MDYPAGWSIERDKPIRGTSDGATTDEFMSPDKEVTVSVQCVPLTNVNTVDQFLLSEINVRKLGGFRDVNVEDSRLTVAGALAPVLNYSFTTEGSTTYFTTVLMVNDCGWLITIAAPTDTKKYRDLFERMLTSFQPERPFPPNEV